MASRDVRGSSVTSLFAHGQSLSQVPPMAHHSHMTKSKGRKQKAGRQADATTARLCRFFPRFWAAMDARVRAARAAIALELARPAVMDDKSVAAGCFSAFRPLWLDTIDRERVRERTCFDHSPDRS